MSVRIETSFSYGPAGDARQFEPCDAPGLAPLLGLHQATVTSAEIRKDGRFTMALGSVAPDMHIQVDHCSPDHNHADRRASARHD